MSDYSVIFFANSLSWKEYEETTSLKAKHTY